MKCKHKKTNAVRELERLNIDVEIVQYEVDEDDLSAVNAASKVQIPMERIFKTLVLRGDDPKKDIVVVVIPGAMELDLKKLAALSGNKKVEMVHVKELQSLTGYIRGGCSPVGIKKPYPVFIDESAFNFTSVSISAGQRGLQMIISPEDLVLATRAAKGQLTRKPLD